MKNLDQFLGRFLVNLEKSCENLIQLSGKLLETWEKGWFSFWEVADKLDKNVGSVVVPTSYNLLGLGFHPHHKVYLLPPAAVLVFPPYIPALRSMSHRPLAATTERIYS